MFLTVATDHDF